MQNCISEIICPSGNISLLMTPDYHGLEGYVQVFKNLNLINSEAFDFLGMIDRTYLLSILVLF